MLSYDDELEMAKFLEQNIHTFAKEYPPEQYDLLVLNVNQYPVLVHSLKALIAYDKAVVSGKAPGIVLDAEKVAAAEEIPKIVPLYDFITENACHICLAGYDGIDEELIHKDGSESEYDRYLVPLPIGWKDHASVFIRGSGILMRETTNVFLGKETIL